MNEENIIQVLTKKYNLAAGSYYKSSPYSADTKTIGFSLVTPREKELRAKWSNYVQEKWYGISLGQPTPEIWFDVLDEFLEYVRANNSEFKILQIKVKFGAARIYLENISEESRGFANQLENLLSDKLLVY